MKFRVTFKDPDGVYEALDSAAREQLGTDLDDAYTQREADDMVTLRRDTLSDQIRPWVEYSEYLTVEFDTEAKTAIVVPKNDI